LNGHPIPSARQQAAVLEALQTSGRRMTKAELTAATGISDRLVRQAVAELVKNGEPIVTDREDGGFIWTTDPTLIEAEVNLLTSHATEILARKRALEKRLSDQRGLFQ